MRDAEYGRERARCLRRAERSSSARSLPSPALTSRRPPASAPRAYSASRRPTTLSTWCVWGNMSTGWTASTV